MTTGRINQVTTVTGTSHPRASGTPLTERRPRISEDIQGRIRFVVFTSHGACSLSREANARSTLLSFPVNGNLWKVNAQGTPLRNNTCQQQMHRVRSSPKPYQKRESFDLKPLIPHPNHRIQHTTLRGA